MMAHGNRGASGAAVDSAFGRLVEGLTARLQSGEPVDWSALAREHPDQADELSAIRPALEALGRLSRAGESAVSGVAPTADDDLLPGVLGDFRIVREIGRGGMGIVYEAEQISLNRKVALKVLPFAATMDPRQLQRFRHEAQAAAMLHHPNVVPVFGVGCERGVHYYAMQLIPGRSLAAMIDELRGDRGEKKSSDEGAAAYLSAGSSVAGLQEAGFGDNGAARPASQRPATEESAAPTAPVAALTTQRTRRDKAHYRHIAELIAQAADALEYAHSMGVVHRDVKPANLLLDDAGQLWVTDFGLAKLDAAVGMTFSGDLIGTLRYMSPEQALGPRGLVDHRTDVYSLGATLYELLTLQPAVDGHGKHELLHKIAFEEPIGPRKHNPAIPAELETVALKALGKLPADRYATAGELAADLRRYLLDQPIRAKPPTPAQWMAKWARRHRILIRSVAVVLAVSVAVMIVALVLLARAWDAAERHRVAAEQKNVALRERVYVADMRRAYDLWQRGVLDDFNAILKSYEPQPGEQDLRAFEWYHLKELSDTRPRLIHTFPAKRGVVYAAVFSPDERLIATTGQQSVIDLWDARTFEQIARLEGHQKKDCNALAFTPDGKLLVSSGDDCTIRIWNVDEHREVGQLLGHTDKVQKVAVSPDGRRVAAAAWDNTVRLWDLETRLQVAELRSADGMLYAVAFSPDGRTLASCATATGHLSLFDMETRQWRDPLEPNLSGVIHCTFSPDGSLLAAASRGVVSVWRARTGQLLHILNTDRGPCRFLAFGPDNSYLASCGDDGPVSMWSMTDGALLCQFLVHHHVNESRRTGWCISVSRDGRRLLTANGDQRSDLWELPDRWAQSEQRATPGSWPLTIAPNAPALAYEDHEGHAFCLCDFRSGNQGIAIQSNIHKHPPLTAVPCAFSADEQCLAYCEFPAPGARSGVKLWDIERHRRGESAPSRPAPVTELTAIGLPSWHPTSLAFARRNRSVISVYPDGLMVEWDRDSGTSRALDSIAVADLPQLTSSADGRIVVVASGYSWRTWDAERRRWVTEGGRLAHRIARICVSADGQMLAACDEMGTMQLVDLATGRERATFVGPQYSMDFSPDGRTLATSSRGMIRLWHVATGQELFALHHSQGIVAAPSYVLLAVRFRSDGRALVGAGGPLGAGRVIVWGAAARD